MKIPLSWLQEYIDVPADPKLIADTLTSIGYMQDKLPEKVADDIVLDVEVRQNRSDCLSILGLARELGAALNMELKPITISGDALTNIEGDTEITIKDPKQCYRFNTLTFENISVRTSPKWLIHKLEAYGIKSINNIVDITNFVMIELGQPLHAFDKAKVEDSHIIIRQAQKGEKFIALGNKDIALIEHDVVISDPSRAIAIAGVIGSGVSGVSEETTSIILEAATYNQARIRRTSLRHKIRTEASLRLEKFLHPHLTELALQRASKFIISLTGGTIIDHTDSYPTKIDTSHITLRVSHVEKLGGIDVPTDKIVEILDSLEITAKKITDGKLECEIPYFRTDLIHEADLVEEVIRIYGYDKIPDKLLSQQPPKNIQSPYYDLKNTMSDIMIGLGYDEQITEPLTAEENPDLKPIQLENSLTSEKTMLRTTLKHSLAYALSNRKKYRQKSIYLFEIGKIYFVDDAQYKETRVLSGIVYDKNITYINIKGHLEALFDHLGYNYDVSLVAIEQVDTQTIYFQLDIEALVASAKRSVGRMLSSPPQVILHDFSFVVSDDIHIGDILTAIRSVDKMVYSVKLGELPRKLDGNMKSVFIKVSYHSPELILTDKDVAPIREHIISTIIKNFSAKMK